MNTKNSVNNRESSVLRGLAADPKNSRIRIGQGSRDVSNTRPSKTPDAASSNYSSKKTGIRTNINSLQDNVKETNRLFNDLRSMWQTSDIPLNHQANFIEAVSDLNFQTINQLITQEIEEIKHSKA